MNRSRSCVFLQRVYAKTVEYSYIILYNMHMKIGVYTNFAKDPHGMLAKKFCGILAKRGIECAFFHGEGDDPGLSALDRSERIGDVLVAFGGDGTMLNVVGCCAERSVPILGVNLGRIGFLTEASRSDLEQVVDRLVAGDYSVEERTMLEAETSDQKSYVALNEIILGTDSNSRVCSIDVEVDGVKADSVRGDGVIVATATGSTAYSLSCNGPVVAPDVKAFVINAICPHSLHFCPLVVSDSSVITLTGDGSKMRVTVDGRVYPAGGGDSRVTVRKSGRSALFVRLGEQGFYEKLIKKLSYWSE